MHYTKCSTRCTRGPARVSWSAGVRLWASGGLSWVHSQETLSAARARAPDPPSEPRQCLPVRRDAAVNSEEAVRCAIRHQGITRDPILGPWGGNLQYVDNGRVLVIHTQWGRLGAWHLCKSKVKLNKDWKHMLPILTVFPPIKRNLRLSSWMWFIENHKYGTVQLKVRTQFCHTASYQSFCLGPDGSWWCISY